MPKYIVQHRRGSAEQWASKDTIIPKEGEIVIEIDEENYLHKLKIGDGIHTYSELSYLQAGDEVVTQVLAKTLPRIITVNLNKDAWESVQYDGNPNVTCYKQVIPIDGVTSQTKLNLQPDAFMLAEFQKLDLVFVAENEIDGTTNENEITVYSIGDKPLDSYTMQATIVEADIQGETGKVVGIPVGTPVSQSNWDQTDETKGDYIKNKPNMIGQSGEGEHSEIFNDYDNNIAQSPYSSASGHNNLAGLKGYYYCQLDENEIQLTKTQGVIPTEPFEIPYKEGDVISMVNGSKYPNCATIVGVTGNCIEIAPYSLPFNSMVEMDPSDYAMDDFSIWVEAKPTEGEVPLGYYASAKGENTQALERASSAEGRDTIAYGQYGHVEGRKCKAAYAAHGEGYNAHASGNYSHAQNRDTIASGNDSSAEGLKSIAIGQASHAQNIGAEAHGYGSTACGQNTQAVGKCSFSTGIETHANGDYSFTAGTATHADGNNSFAIGYYTVAGSRYQFVRGRFNEIDTEGKYIDIVGNGGGEDTRSNAYTLTEKGDGWFNNSVTAKIIKATDSFSLGVGYGSLSSNGLNATYGNFKYNLHADGSLSIGKKATIGEDCTINGALVSHGSLTIGHNSSAHQSCIAVGSYCDAGNSDGDIRYAVALGYNNNALFGGSSAIGQGLTTGRSSQHVVGEYNKVDSDALFVLGNGSDINHKSNAFTVGKNGNAWFAGDITIGADNKKLATEEYVDSKNTSSISSSIVDGVLMLTLA